MPWPRSGSITVRVLAIGERLVLQRIDHRTVCRADDAMRAEELFHAVRRPAGHAGDGEQRRKERLGHAEHLVDKARVPVSYTHLDVYKRQRVCWMTAFFRVNAYLVGKEFADGDSDDGAERTMR